jgi:hypothetical protein
MKTDGVNPMTSDLKQAIQLAQSLSFSEQLELLKVLSRIIQQTHSQAVQHPSSEEETHFSAESFRISWQQAMTGQTLPLSKLWEGSEDD